MALIATVWFCKCTAKEAKEMLENGYDPKNGARPLRREIEDKVESLLSEEIIAGSLKKGDIPTLKLVNKKLKNGYDPTEAIDAYWDYFGRSDLE